MRVFCLFPSSSLNNDPQLEFFSVTTHCSNVRLLALQLILCTQGHEDFNLSSCTADVCIGGHVHARTHSVLYDCAEPVCVACVCARIHERFLIFFPLYFCQITNSNELPLAIIAHFSTDLTR